MVIDDQMGLEGDLCLDAEAGGSVSGGEYLPPEAAGIYHRNPFLNGKDLAGDVVQQRARGWKVLCLCE